MRRSGSATPRARPGLTERACSFIARTACPASSSTTSTLTDEHRLYALTEHHWLGNPAFKLLRDHVGLIGAETLARTDFLALAREHGYTGASDHPLFGPLIGPSGWFGTVIFGLVGEASIDLERQLMLLATRLSVWCTDHGVSRLPDNPASALSARSHQIAGSRPAVASMARSLTSSASRSTP